MKKKTKILFAAGAVAVAAAVVLLGMSRLQNKKILPMATADLSLAGIDVYDKTVTLIANRGLSALAPEDTYFSVEKAGREGFVNVEIDARETLDGVWVLMHDETITRMTDGNGKIENLTYYELLNFTVDNGANIEEYEKVKIPTLEQVLELCSQYGIRPFINVEKISAEGFGSIVKILERLDMVQRCAIKSSNKDCIEKIKTLKPQIELWHTVDKLTNKNIEWFKENKEIGADFNANQKANTDEKIKQLLKEKIKLSCRNVNDIETLKKMYSLGLRSFCTDCILPK